MKPTFEQEEIENFKEGNLQVIACAGSGKTTSISRRIAKLLSTGVKPKNIVAFTFTDKAAEVMKYKTRKFVSELSNSPGDLGEMYIGTIHSFCFELLKRYRPDFLAYEVLDDNQRVIFFKKHYFDLGLDNTEIKHITWYSKNHTWTTISNMIKNIDTIREEQIPISEVSNKDFKKIFEGYNALLHKKKSLDFSSMMSLAVEMLESDFEILTDVRKNVKYLIVDEYQDINPVQERLIELMTMKENVCVVGDDDQAIYQWRGTKVKNILTFAKRYSHVTQKHLVQNFRSSPGVIKHANSVISVLGEGKRLPKEMVWGKKKEKSYEEGDIYSSYFKNQEEEISFVIKKIKELYGTKIIEEGEERALDWRDFALIFRSVSKDAKLYIDKFKEVGIPYVVKGSIGLFDRDEIRLIVDVLAFVLEPDYTLQYDLKNEKSKKAYLSLFEGKKPDYTQFLSKISHIKQGLKGNRYVNLQKIFQHILNAIGAKDFRIKDEILYNLGQMSMVISDYEGQYFPVSKTPKNLGYFFEFLFEHASFSYEEGGHDEKFGSVKAVQIMTMHRCKGLEFPVVFLPAFTKRGFPTHRHDDTRWFIDDSLFDKKAYLTTEDSQRRLLYVAMTRSMKYLFVTYSLIMDSYKQQQLPSEFIKDFADDFIIRANNRIVDDPTRREKSNKFIISPTEVFPTNFSELGFYFDCPYDFKLRWVMGFNPVLDPMLGYGKSVHNILNSIHKTLQRGKKPDVDAIIDKNFHLKFAKEEDEEKSKKKAVNVVKNYVDNYKEDFELSLETEKPFEIILGHALVSGQIDLIRKDTPQGPEITIVDFKTELEPDEFRKTKHREQVLLYGLAYKTAFDKSPEKLYVHYLDGLKGNRVQVVITDENINKVINKIKSSVEDIKRGNFPRKPYIKSRCNECNFKLICKGCE